MRITNWSPLVSCRVVVASHGFEALLQSREIIGEMPHAAAQLVTCFLMLAVQPPQARDLGVNPRLLTYVTPSLSVTNSSMTNCQVRFPICGSPTSR